MPTKESWKNNRVPSLQLRVGKAVSYQDTRELAWQAMSCVGRSRSTEQQYAPEVDPLYFELSITAGPLTQ